MSIRFLLLLCRENLWLHTLGSHSLAAVNLQDCKVRVRYCKSCSPKCCAYSFRWSRPPSWHCGPSMLESE